MEKRPNCCEKAEEAVWWRKLNTFRGPFLESGWCIISNIYFRAPTFMNITYCPFCRKKLIRKKYKKTSLQK